MDLFTSARYSLRRLAKSPGFSFVVLLTLGLGIGANTAIFSVVNALLLRPLPYDRPEQLVTVNHFYPSLNGLEASVSARGFRDYSTGTRSFSDMAVETWTGMNLTGDGEPERLETALATPTYFATLGAAAAVGRVFGPEVEAEGESRVVVLSHGLWERRFAADPSAVGRTLTLNGEPYTVVGVMPRGFHDAFVRTVEMWTPLVFTEAQYARSYTNEYLALVARLDPSADIETSRAEMVAFAERLKTENPEQFPADWSLRVTPLQELATRDFRPALMVLLASVVFVLLIACANVANLLLARSVTRRRELAVRVAVGADRGDILRQLVVDGLVLGALGAVVGIAVGFGGIEALKSMTERALPRLGDVSLDGRVLFFTVAVSLVTGLLVGLAPALRTLRTDVQAALRDGDRSGGDRSGLLVRRAFVVSQFALALSLLAGAGLLIRSMARLQAVDPGFDARGVVAFHLALPSGRYPTEVEQRAFYDELLRELSGVPGVAAAGATSVLPFSGGWSTGSFGVEGHEPAPGEPNPWGDIRIVSPGFQQALGVPLVRGRFFTEADGPDGPRVVVVDEEMVRRFWPDTDPIGRRIGFGEDWMEVVGVVRHAAHEGLDATPRVQLYGSSRQFVQAAMFVVARAGSSGEPTSLVPALREVVRRADPSLPLARVNTMARLIDDSVGQRRVSMLLLGIFAAVALLLAATGIYGVMAQTVAQRTRELGVRMAMGAGRGDVLGLVLKQGMAMAGMGVVLGLLGAVGLTRLIQSQLFGIGATDPATFAVVVVILLVMGCLATLIPARRATRVHPTEALRGE